MMNWQYTPYTLPLIAAAAVSAGLALYAWQRRPAPGASPFTLLMLAVAWWSLGYALELASVDLPSKVLWAKVEYLGIVTVSVMWLIFAIQYVGRERWLTRRNILLLAAVPFVSLLLVWTNDLHRLIWSEIRIDTSGPLSMLELTHGAWFWVLIAYSYLALSLGTFLLLRALIHAPSLYRGQAVALFLGILAPWVGNGLYISGLSPDPGLDLTPFGFTLTGFIAIWGLFRTRLLDIVPVACDSVIESMSDGVIMLDAQNRIVDLNPAAERIIGRTASGVIGQPAAQAFPDWLQSVERFRDMEEAQEEIAVGEGDARRCYDLRISLLYDRRKRLTGRLITLHDITERRRVEKTLRESSQFNQAIVSSAREGIIIYDRQLRYVLWNSFMEEMSGIAAEHVLGKYAPDVFPHLREQGVVRLLQRAVAGEAVTSEDTPYYVPQTGKSGWVSGVYGPYRDANGDIIGVIGVVRDITERKRAEEALRESEARYQDLYHNAPDLYDSLGPDGTILDINETGARMLGYTREELIGRHVSQILSPEIHDRLREEFAASQERREPLEMEVPYRCKDGRTLWCHLRTEWVRDDAGQVLGSRGIARDITERKRAEEALRESEEKFRIIFHKSLDVIMIMDGESGRILHVNQAARHVLGYEDGALTGSHFSILFPPSAETSGKDLLEGPPVHGAVFESQEFLRADGSVCPMDLTAVLIPWGKGKAILATFRDVSERKRAEDALQQRFEQLQAIYHLTDAVSRTGTIEEVYEQALDGLQRTLKANRAAVLLFDPDGVIRFKAWRALSEGYRKAAEGHSPWQPDEKHPQPVLVPDVREEPSLEGLRGVILGEGIHALGFIPLVYQGRLLGKFMIYYDAPHQFEADEVQLAQTIAGHIAFAIERARAETALRRRAEELAALHETSLDITMPHDRPVLLHTIVERAARLLDAPGGGLYLCDPERQEVRCVVSHNTPRDYTGTVLKYGEGAAGIAAQTGEPLIIDDYRSWPGRAAAYEEDQPFTAVLSAPMIWQGRVTGVIHVLHDVETRRFAQADLELLTLFANHAAIVVENARLLEAEREQRTRAEARAAELRDRERHLMLLNDITLAAIESSDFQTLLQTLADRMGELLEADGCYIALWDEGQQRAIPAAAYGLLRETYPSIRAEPGETTMTESVLRAGHPLIAEDVFNSPYTSPRIAALFPARSLLGLPLIAGDQKLGAALIAFNEPYHFTPDEIVRGEQAAGQVALAVAKAQLLEEARLRARRQAALVQLSADLAATLDEEEVCHRVVQGLYDALGYANQGIFLVDETTGERVCRACMGWPDAPADWRIPPGQGLTERALLNGQLHYTPDVTQDLHYVPGLGSGAEVDVPISVGGKVIGVLAVESREPHAFGPDDFEVIGAAANQAGIALSNARSLEVARQRAQEAETLRQAGAVVAATLQQDEAIQRILEQLEQVVPYDSASVQLLREGYVEIVGGRGWENPDAVVGLRFPVPADNPNTVVIQERRPYILDDAPVAHAPFRDDPHSHIRSWLGVPLIVGDRVIGMVTVDSTQPNHFTPDHARLATAFADQVAIALENARLFEAERRRSEELEALRQAGLSLTSSLELQPVLEAILHHTLRLVAATDVHIFLYDGERLTFGAALWTNGRQQTPYAEPRSDGFTYTVARSGERVVVPDVDTHPIFQDWPWGGAIAGLPLSMGDQVRGVMNVAFDRPHTFDEEELRVLELLADQAAIALENARLFEAEQRRREVGTALLEIAQVASSSLELKQILKHIARLTAEACQTDRCSIFLLDDTQEYLEPVMSQFADGHVEPEMWRRFKDATADQVDVVPLFRDAIRERRPALLDDPARTDLMPRKWTEPFGIQKLLVVPLISHDRVIGLMALDYTDADREFTLEQIELAQTIGGQVAVSIANAQLYARTQQLAITDSLTGLYNRRGFFELGRREVERAKRFGRPLTAIMFDLDHFKRVNDAFGHPIGDQVLAGLAELCRHELREVDLLGRYGGEEFTALLPESGLTIARPVAERLRRRVEQAIFNTDQGPIKITISLGIAALDEKSADVEALLERADQALYAAKRAGRNQVSAWHG